MGMMQVPFDIVQHNAEPRAMSWLNCGAEVVQQGLDLAPVDVAAERSLKDCAEQGQMLVAHDFLPLIEWWVNPATGRMEWQQRQCCR